MDEEHLLLQTHKKIRTRCLVAKCLWSLRFWNPKWRSHWWCFGQAHKMETRYEDCSAPSNHWKKDIVIQLRSYLPNKKHQKKTGSNPLMNLMNLHIKPVSTDWLSPFRCGGNVRQESCWNDAAIEESPRAVAVTPPETNNKRAWKSAESQKGNESSSQPMGIFRGEMLLVSVRFFVL